MIFDQISIFFYRYYLISQQFSVKLKNFFLFLKNLIRVITFVRKRYLFVLNRDFYAHIFWILLVGLF